MSNVYDTVAFGWSIKLTSRIYQSIVYEMTIYGHVPEKRVFVEIFNLQPIRTQMFSLNEFLNECIIIILLYYVKRS